MSRSRAEIEKFICETYEQSPANCIEGPARVGPYLITRVWTEDRHGEYHAHYAVECGDEITPYDNFSPFAAWLAEELDLDAYTGRTERRVRLFVAAAVVLVGLGLLVFLIGWRPQQSSEIKYLLSAIVGAGASYVFLTKLPKKPV